jgi:hypothetical protein
MRSLTLLIVTLSVLGVVNAAINHPSSIHEQVLAGFNVKSANKAEIQRNIRVSQFDRVFSISSSHQWVSLLAYNTSTTCSGTVAGQVSVGTYFCMSSSTITGSAQYTYTDSVVYFSTYSDSACTTNTGNTEFFDTTDEANTCVAGTTASFYVKVASSFSTPNAAGFLAGEYSSESNCDNNMPFMAVWADLADTDDDFTLSCTSTTTDDGGDYDVYVSASMTTASSSSKKCFAGSETVLLSTGETIPISDVKIGDSILAADKMGNTKFSQVISLPHDKNDERATFAFLTTATGRSIKMTPEHIVMVDPSCGTKTVLMKASEVEKDMCLVTVEGQEQVTAVSSVSGNGIYTVITNEEMVVVNGIIASPFAVNHATSHAWYNVFRAAYSVAPGLMGLSLVKQANLVFGSILDSIGM